MAKHIYVIRHCEAKGQSSDASLTERGFHRAEVLAEFFSDKKLIVLLLVLFYEQFNL